MFNQISQHLKNLSIPVVEMKVRRRAFLSNDSHPVANIESQYKLNIRIITHTVIPILLQHQPQNKYIYIYQAMREDNTGNTFTLTQIDY